MDFFTCNTLTESHKTSVFDLWNAEYPKQLNYSTLSDFNNYLNALHEQSHILLIDRYGRVKGWYFDFKRAHERWFAIILDSTIHGKGYGSKLLRMGKQKRKRLQGWVIDHNTDIKKNGVPYKSPLNFYLKNGFEKLEHSRLERQHISAVKIIWVKN